MVFVFLQLRSLGGVDDVFEDERMQAEVLADFLNDVEMVNTVNIDPRDGGFVTARKGFFDGFGLALFDLAFGIVDDADLDGSRPFAADVHERARSKPRAFGLFHKPRRIISLAESARCWPQERRSDRQ